MGVEWVWGTLCLWSKLPSSEVLHCETGRSGRERKRGAIIHKIGQVLKLLCQPSRGEEVHYYHVIILCIDLPLSFSLACSSSHGNKGKEGEILNAFMSKVRLQYWKGNLLILQMRVPTTFGFWSRHKEVIVPMFSRPRCTVIWPALCSWLRIEILCRSSRYSICRLL